MSNLRFVTGLVVGVAMAGVISGSGRSEVVGRGPPVQTSAYENVQVLFDAPPGQLQQIMEAMSASLGVTCEYCHDANDRASDANPVKETARDMIRMVVESSESYFEVLEAPSCWTCHRGSPTPEN